jgi:DUF1365 family protein
MPRHDVGLDEHAAVVNVPTSNPLSAVQKATPVGSKTVRIVVGTSDKEFHVFPASAVRTKYVLVVQPISTRAQLEIPATAVAAVGLVRLMAVIGGRSEDVTVLQVCPSFSDS